MANNTTAIDISVIVPVYNAEQFISACLNSIIAQDFDSLEVLVSDDCSSDGTRLVLDQFIAHKCIKIFYQPKNLGITKNCNFLLQQAKGKYICFFAGDDVMLPTKLHKQFLFMERNTHCSFSYHKVEILNTLPGQVVNTTKSKSKAPLKDAADIIKKMGVPGSMSMMVKASSIPDRMFSEKYNYVSDWLMQIDLALDGGIGFIDEFLCQYRNFGDNNGKDITDYEHEFISLLENVETEFPSLARACKEGKARYLLGRSFREGSILRRREILKKSVKLNLTPVSGFLLVSCYVPFIEKLFSFVYSKRMFLKKFI